MENSVSMVLELSPGLNEKISQLAEQNGTSPDVVLLKALVLYDLASLAKQQCQHLGIFDTDRRVVAEVVGV